MTCFATSDSVVPHKLHHTILPPVYALALFLENITHQEPSWSDRVSISDWHGVTCDSNGEVTSLGWSNLSLRGTPGWKHLPHTLLSINLGNIAQRNVNIIQGSLEVVSLPRNLRYLDVRRNEMGGALALSLLPPLLEGFFASYNHFYGVLKSSFLPSTLVSLDLSYNNFEGVLSLEEMQQSTAVIHLYGNNLTPNSWENIPATVLFVEEYTDVEMIEQLYNATLNEPLPDVLPGLEELDLPDFL